MNLLNGRFCQAHNLAYARKGHLFEDRFEAVVAEKEAYLLELCRYVVLNPVRAGMVPSAGDNHRSNSRATAGQTTEAGSLTIVDWTLGSFGSETGRARMDYRRFAAEEAKIWETSGLGGPGEIGPA